MVTQSRRSFLPCRGTKEVIAQCMKCRSIQYVEVTTEGKRILGMKPDPHMSIGSSISNQHRMTYARCHCGGQLSFFNV